MLITLKNFLKNITEIKTSRKLLMFLSDDWGSVRIRSKHDQNQLIKKGLNINNRFDLYDALETNEDLERLFEVLMRHKDQQGNHPVITAVFNVANPDFQRIKESGFKEYFYETIESTYQRYENSDQVLALIKKGITQGIFVPQSHGREHLQVNWWMEELKNKRSYARNFFEHEYFFLGPEYLNFPKRNRGLGAAFDVWDKRDIEMQREVIQTGLRDFRDLFGYRSRIFCPPAMFYNQQIETVLFKEGIEWLDVGRFFKTPQVGGGHKWQLNYLGRKKQSGLRVLVRNGIFEPNISEKDNGVDRALFDVEQAFKAKQPAILSNHRAAFIGRIDTRNREKGLRALDELLGKMLKKWPDVEFVSVDKICSINLSTL